MSERTGWTARIARWINRYRARTSGRGRIPTAFVQPPEPRTIGSFARGKHLNAGKFLFAGYLVEAPDASIWDLPAPDDGFTQEIHGFGWLDDLASVGDLTARHRAVQWTGEWIEQFGRGTGPGWVPELAGRRLTRWIHHGVMLLGQSDKETSAPLFRAMARHTRYLSRSWRGAPPGLPRFEALGGFLHGALALEGQERFLAPATRLLERECAARIDDSGGLPSRNPEELLEVFAILTHASDAMNEAGHRPPEGILAAIRNIAPTLRVLRHADGGLARFHGGGRGAEGRLDTALAASGIRQMRRNGLSMGYARLSKGRTTVIVDAAPPPSNANSLNGHASTLAFELTSGRRPVIVNCGSGESFGSSWRRAGRATASHSTVAIEGYSSSRLGGQGMIAGRRMELLVDIPRDVTCTQGGEGPAAMLVLSHDGYLKTHGLQHHRRLELAADGRSLIGDDSLAALTQEAERSFDAAFDRSGMQGVPFAIRFHLHPDAEAELDLGGAAVSVSLRSGEIWVFRHDGVAELSLTPSVYLERGRLSPRATKQIVLKATVADYSTRIGWTLAKAQDTPAHVRDLALEQEMEAAPR